MKQLSEQANNENREHEINQIKPKKLNFEIENMRKCPNELSNEAATR